MVVGGPPAIKYRCKIVSLKKIIECLSIHGTHSKDLLKKSSVWGKQLKGCSSKKKLQYLRCGEEFPQGSIERRCSAGPPYRPFTCLPGTYEFLQVFSRTALFYRGFVVEKYLADFLYIQQYFPKKRIPSTSPLQVFQQHMVFVVFLYTGLFNQVFHSGMIF